MNYEWWLLSNYEQFAAGQAMARNKELSKKPITSKIKRTKSLLLTKEVKEI